MTDDIGIEVGTSDRDNVVLAVGEHFIDLSHTATAVLISELSDALAYCIHQQSIRTLQ